VSSIYQEQTARRREIRRDCQDTSVRSVKEKSQRIDLGIELLYRIALPGVRYTREEIAYFAGCTDGAIFLIEQKAMRRLANRALYDKALRQLLVDCLESGRSYAKPTHSPIC
jgi:hypothetical protein